MKRPLGCACLFFILFVRVFYVLFPPVLADYGSRKGQEVYVNGQISAVRVQHIEGETQITYTLKAVSLTEDSTGSSSYGNSNEKEIIYSHDKIYCNFQDPKIQLHIGEWVWVRGTFMPYTQAENPGQFDSRLYYHIKGVGAEIKNTKLVWHGEAYHVFADGLYRVKAYFADKLERRFGETYGAVMKNILLGDNTDIDAETKQLFQEGGILHILSISGSHISMLGMGCVGIFRKCGLDKKTSAGMGFLVVLLYGMMIGTTASSFRAICMFGFQMAAVLLGRTYDRLTGLSVAAVLLLLEQPMYVFYSGFLLSFGAVLGITLLAPVVTELTKSKGWLLEKAGSVFSGSIGILLATFPIQVCYFYEYPVYSTLVNVLILPFLNWLIGLGAVVLAIPEAYSVFAVPFVYAGQCILYGYEWICRQSQRLPFHCLVVGAPGTWQILLYYSCLAGCICLLRSGMCHTAKQKTKKQQSYTKYSYIGMGIVSSLVMLLFLWRPVQGLTCRFLSVGQGDCTILQCAGASYIVDCGSSSKKKTGTRILLPCLKYYGVSKVDAVFLSHADADHTNGIINWLEEYEHSHVRMERMILPDLAEDKLEQEFGELMALAKKHDIPIVTLAAGTTLHVGALCIEVLYPEAEYTEIENANGYSQVLSFSYADKCILMTGDIGTEQETELLAEPFAKKILSQDITVLKAAHHGSKYSGSQAFLDMVSPAHVIFSYGVGNRYGHPHQETIERVENVGADTWYTGRDGMITCILTKHGQSLDGMLQ